MSNSKNIYFTLPATDEQLTHLGVGTVLKITPAIVEHKYSFAEFGNGIERIIGIENMSLYSVKGIIGTHLQRIFAEIGPFHIVRGNHQSTLVAL